MNMHINNETEHGIFCSYGWGCEGTCLHILLQTNFYRKKATDGRISCEGNV